MIKLKNLIQELTVREIGHPTVMLDMDGVLCDFETQFKKYSGGIEAKDYEARDKRGFWKLIHKAGQSYWSDMPWMPDGKVLFNYLKKLDDDGIIYLEILSATSKSNPEAYTGKHIWARRELGNTIRINLVEKGIEKAKFASPTKILIDDKEKVIAPWRAAGGIGILHTNAADTIDQLKAILNIK